MSKATIEVQGVTIAVLNRNNQDYISLTDIARYRNSQEPFAIINNWMRSRSTIEFLGLWEKLSNPGFKPLEFERFKTEAGSNYFVLSPQRWIEATQAIGITSKSGRYGGTFAHRDIAFEFATWISSEFKLYLIKEFQRLKDEESDRLKLGWNLQRKDIEKSLLDATSPFVFSTVNERSILRFLKLIACDNSKIGTYAKLVDDRNETAHPNGNIFYSTEAALDVKVTDILRVVAEIQTHSKPVIEYCYREFLLQNHDPDEREYPDATDQIREVLIHGNYLSQKDIEICLGFEVETLADQPGSEGMRELHAALVETYKTEHANSAVQQQHAADGAARRS